MSAPIALFTSCSKLNQDEIIKSILKVECLPEGKRLTEGVLGYSWSIDTRYYTANIALCSTNVRTIGDAEFAANVEAVIIHFDTKDEESLAQVKRWLPFLKEMEPDIQLLICDTCKQGDALSREQAWKWCLENSFELIELHPQLVEDSDEEDDFKETVGVDRIIQALHSHSWPNLVMKDKPSYRSSLMTQMMRDEAKLKRELHHDTSNDVSSNDYGPNHATTVQENQSDITQRIGDTPVSSDISDFPNLLCASGSQTGNSADIWGKTDVVGEEGFENNFLDYGKAASNETGENGATGGGGCHAKDSEVDGKMGKVRRDQEGSLLSSQVTQICDVKSEDAGAARLNGESSSKDDTKDTVMADEDLQMLAALGGDSDHIDADSFEKLFDKLRVMKVQAEALPLDQRKQYAEKVAVEFWRAIGGEEEEIDGLSSDDENST